MGGIIDGVITWCGIVLSVVIVSTLKMVIVYIVMIAIRKAKVMIKNGETINQVGAVRVWALLS